MECEDFLHLHMQSLADEYIKEDNNASLYLELLNRVRDLRSGIASKLGVEEIWRLAAWVGKYAAELGENYEALHYRKE